VIYERQQRFRLDAAEEMVKQLVAACREVGIVCQDESPVISYQNGQGRIGEV
jgi:eukaryotic translation initiation factor 2C